MMKNNRFIEPECVLFTADENLLKVMVKEGEDDDYKPSTSQQKVKEEEDEDYKPSTSQQKVPHKKEAVKKSKSKTKKLQKKSKEPITQPLNADANEEILIDYPIKKSTRVVDLTKTKTISKELEDQPINLKANEEILIDYPIKSATKVADLKKEENNTKQLEDNKEIASIYEKYDQIISNKVQLSCHMCKVQFENFTALLKHFHLDHDEEFSSNSEEDEETDDEDYNDDQKASSKKPKSVYEHIDIFITENIQLYCDLCELHFDNFTSLRKHFQVKHKQRGYTICCKRRFFHRSDIVDHIQTHKNPEIFKCNTCGKILADRRCLRMHIRTMHEVDRNTQTNFGCDICGKVLATKHSLQLHNYIMHEVSENDRETCTECNKTFRNKVSLTNHIKNIHLQKYAKVCDLCGTTIANRRLFKRHMLEHEGKTLPKVACTICGRVYAEKKGLKRHLILAHPIEKVEYSCNICGKNFASQDNMKYHVKIVHESTYEQTCTECGKTFKRPETFKDHMSRHNNTPMHSCRWCTDSFYTNAQMHAHHKKIHPKEWEQFIRDKHSGNLPDKYKLPATFQINSF